MADIIAYRIIKSYSRGGALAPISEYDIIIVMKRKTVRLQAYAELLGGDLGSCREKEELCSGNFLAAADGRIRGWLYRDFLLSLYLLIFDTQKEQRSVSCQNVYDLLQQQKEETQRELEALWRSRELPGGFQVFYRSVEESGRQLLHSGLRRPLKMVRDKMLTHREVKTEGKERRLYRLSDFPEITPEALRQLLEEAAVFIRDLQQLVHPGRTRL